MKHENKIKNKNCWNDDDNDNYNDNNSHDVLHDK